MLYTDKSSSPTDLSLSTNNTLCLLYFWQEIWTCRTVSSSWHSEQFPSLNSTWCRVLLRNVWPILSLIILTSSFLFHPLLLQTSLTQSLYWTLKTGASLYSQTSLHTILSPSDLNKEMMDSTLSLFTASFASLSTFSFARMPTCAGTHIREILTPLLAISPYCQEDLMHKILPAPRSTPPNTFDRRHRVTAHQDIAIFKLSHPLYCHQDSSQLNSKYTQIVWCSPTRLHI